MSSTDATTIAGALLVVGPVVGAIPIAHPALVRVWAGPRERYLAIIGEHRRAWYVLNAGFSLATISTAAGLGILAAASDVTTARGAWLIAVAVAYALGGVQWLAMLAIRAVRDPLLADMVAQERPTEPAESLLGAATSGLFAAFVYTTALTLIALAAVLGLAGGVAAPVAVVAGAVAALVLAVQLRTGDCIPAILYVPSLVVGVALLAGWA
jgi:hypothetical protein